MADDRLYLQCNICGGKFYLGKQFAWGSFFIDEYDPKKPFIDRLNDFYEAHYHPGSWVCRWNGNYSIIYETDDWHDINEIVVPCQFKLGKKCDDCEGLAICEKNNKKHGHCEEVKE